MDKRIFVFALAASTALSSATAARAQTAEGAQAASDIIVTARRVEERLQDVPISITVFNQESLSNKNVVSAVDLVSFTPSLSANSRFGSDNVTFAIRGFVSDIGTAPTVGVYFADVVAPRGGATGFPSGDGAGAGSFFDLQNVQVLKGPQGTLFGRNTTGGAILLVPQKPTDRLGGYVEGSIGNFDMRRAQAVLNLPLSDTFKMRLGVDHQKRDGTLRNLSPIGPDRLNDVNYLAVRGSILGDLTPNLENYTIFSYSRSNTRGTVNKSFVCNRAIPPLNPFNSSTVGPNFFAPSACANIDAQNAAGFYTVHSAVPDPHSTLTQWQAINTTTWRAGDQLTIKNIVSYAQQKQSLQSSVFGIYATVRPNLVDSYAAFPGAPFNLNEINPLPNGYNSNQSTFTEELQFQGGSGDGRLVWQVGGYIEVSDPVGTPGNQTAGSINCADTATFRCTDVLAPTFSVPFGTTIPVGFINVTRGKTKFRNYGVYGQATYEVAAGLKLTGGIRYTWDKMSTDTQLIVNSVIGGVAFPTRCGREDAVLPACRTVAGTSSDKPTWVVSLDYTPVDDVLLYAKYSRGYRAGGLKVDGPVEYTYFRPEKLDTYEVGLKSSFSGAVSGLVNLSAFYNDFSNQQIHFGFAAKPSSGLASTAGAVNAGKSRLYGLEADVSVSPFAGINLTGSYTYLNTRIKQIVPVTLPASSPYEVSALVMAGDPLLLAPKHKVILGADYSLPLDESVGNISFGVSYVYTSKQYANYVDRYFTAATGGINYSILPDTNLLNINVNWRSVGGTPIDLAFFATNVTKEKYATFYDGLFSGAGFETGSVGEPRMYGVRVKYRFGD